MQSLVPAQIRAIEADIRTLRECIVELDEGLRKSIADGSRVHGAQMGDLVNRVSAMEVSVAAMLNGDAGGSA
jgi:hypothetical protein